MADEDPRLAERIHDDFVLPFTTVKSRMTGRIVRLGAVADTILARHDQPAPVSELLGQALALTAMLGSNLKFNGGLTVQSHTDGIVNMFVANYETPGRLRGYAGFDHEQFRLLQQEVDSDLDPALMIGHGHLALTIDPGEGMERYQGIVALEGGGLAAAAHTYFRQSEQLPTFVRLAVARQFIPGTVRGAHGAPTWQWRAGGLIVQHVSPVGGKPRAKEELAGDDTELGLFGEDDDNWRRVEMLASTVEDHELLDPMLSPERLLYRLFHEEGVRVTPAEKLEEFCRCSIERVATFLKTFAKDDISELRDVDGNITITCEFCSTDYRFDPATGEPLGRDR
jgi:molecular chaperone Hsp33